MLGCEPASVDEGIGLSAPVSDAVPEAVRLIEELLADGEPGESAPRATAAWDLDMRRDRMKKIVIGGAALAAMVALGAELFPDLRRYLRIRRM